MILYGEDGSQEKSIDLANYNYEQLHQLFKTHFRTKVQKHTSRMPHTCLARALHVPCTCLTHASHVTHTCPARDSHVSFTCLTRASGRKKTVSPAAPPPVQEMVGGRRLYAVNASTPPLDTPPLLNDASAPQPDVLGWRLADTLAEWVSCCDSLQQALLYLVLGGALMALLAKLLLSASNRRQRVRTSKDTATSEDTAGVCHIA